MRLISRGRFALILTVLLSACGQSTEIVPQVVRPDLPDVLPLETRAACYDPGVTNDALADMAQHRVALADCRRKHAASVTAFDALRVIVSR